MSLNRSLQGLGSSILMLAIALSSDNTATAAEARVATDIVCLSIADQNAFSETWTQEAIQRTQDLFESMVTDIGDIAEIPVTISRVPPQSLTKEGVLNAIKGLNVTEATTLIVYYLGHGGTDKTQGHYLQLPQRKSLLRSEVLDQSLLLAKRPLLLILVTDCCSSTIPAAAAPARRLVDKKTAVRNLFLQHSGVVDITAASYDPDRHSGQSAHLIFNGAVFTNALCQQYFDLEDLRVDLIDTNADGFISWSEFFSRVQRSTAQFADGLRMGSSQIGEQVPQAFSLGTGSGDRTSRLRRNSGLSLKENSGAVVVAGVVNNSPATRIVELNGVSVLGSRFINGDTITRVNGRATKTIAEFENVLSELPSKSPVRIQGFDASNRRSTLYSAFIRLEE